MAVYTRLKSRRIAGQLQGLQACNSMHRTSSEGCRTRCYAVRIDSHCGSGLQVRRSYEPDVAEVNIRSSKRKGAEVKGFRGEEFVPVG